MKCGNLLSKYDVLLMNCGVLPQSVVLITICGILECRTGYEYTTNVVYYELLYFANSWPTTKCCILLRYVTLSKT